MKKCLCLMILLLIILLAACSEPPANNMAQISSEEYSYNLQEEIEEVVTETQEESLSILETVSGIIAVTTYVQKGSPSRITLISIDPATGSARTVRDFNIPGSSFMDGNSVKPLNRNYYSQDFTKITGAKKDITTGRQDAGWFSEDGQFFNVSNVIFGEPGDFDGIRIHTAVGFAVDGSNEYFYFYTENSNEAPLLRVPIDMISEDFLEIAAEDLVSYPHGLHPVNTERVRFTDWLNETQFISYYMYSKNYSLKMPLIIVICDGLAEKDKNSFGGYSDLRNENVVVPEVEGRRNWGGVGAPDGNSIAFLSDLIRGTAPPSLFCVQVSGSGQPTKIETSIPFSKWSEIPEYSLLVLGTKTGTSTELLTWE